MEYNRVNNIPWCEGEIIKYVTRWKLKGGITDLRKAYHILGELIKANES